MFKRERGHILKYVYPWNITFIVVRNIYIKKNDLKKKKDVLMNFFFFDLSLVKKKTGTKLKLN